MVVCVFLASYGFYLFTMHACVMDEGEGGVPECLRRIEKLLNTGIEFQELDLLDRTSLEELFKKVSASIQYASFKYMKCTT